MLCKVPCYSMIAVVLLPPQRRAELPGGRRRRSPARRHQRRQNDVGLGPPAQRIDVPQSRKSLADILAGVPADEQAKNAAGNTARVYRFDVPKPGDLIKGRYTTPGFDHALHNACLIEAVVRAADRGMRQKLGYGLYS